MRFSNRTRTHVGRNPGLPPVPFVHNPDETPHSFVREEKKVPLIVLLEFYDRMDTSEEEEKAGAYIRGNNGEQLTPRFKGRFRRNLLRLCSNGMAIKASSTTVFLFRR